jgi:hypothetical protein
MIGSSEGAAARRIGVTVADMGVPMSPGPAKGKTVTSYLEGFCPHDAN